MTTLTIEDIKTRIDELDHSTLARSDDSPSGKYGYYLDLGNGLGCKIQSCVSNAQGEYDNLERLKDSGITPLPYDLREIKVNGKTRYAIFMEHIDGIRLGDLFDVDCDDDDGKEHDECLKWERSIASEANERFCDYGIRHGDCHWNNIIITDTGSMSYKIIDFTPDYIHECWNQDEMEVMQSEESSLVMSDEIKGTDSDQLQFEFMQDVTFTHVSIRYLLITRIFGCQVKSEIFVNKELATEEMQGNIGYDLMNGHFLNTYEIIPFYVAKSQF